MWWWLWSAEADAAQLAIARVGDGLVVVTTWHLHPEVWWIPSPDAAPERTAVDGVATNPTVACGPKRCDVGWIQLAPEAEGIARFPGPAWASFDRKGLGPPQPLPAAEPNSVVSHVAFVAEEKGTTAYVQTHVDERMHGKVSVARAPLRRGALGPAEVLTAEALPGLTPMAGGVWWRDPDGNLLGSSPTPPSGGFLLQLLEGDRVVDLLNHKSEIFVTLSTAGDAAVWGDAKGTVHAAWLAADGQLAQQVVVEQVEPERVGHAAMELLGAALLGGGDDGLVPLTIPVQVTRQYTGAGAVELTLGDQRYVFDLVATEPDRRPPFNPMPAGQAELTTTTQRADERSPETWRWDHLFASLPPLAFPEPCTDADPLFLEVSRGPGDTDWDVSLRRRGSSDGRFSGTLAGPLPGEGDALTGTAKYHPQCGGAEFPITLRWTLGEPTVTQELMRPKGIGGPF